MPAFILLCATGMLGRLSYEMARSPITPLYARHLGAPTQVIGLLVAAVTITGIFVKFPSGALADLFGFRRLMIVGLLVKASAPFMYLAATSWPQLLAIRFYHGLSTALYAPAASARVAQAFPGARGQRLGVYGASENAGVVLGPMLGAAILSSAGFSGAFIVSGGIGIAALLAILWLPLDRPPRRESETASGVLQTLLRGLGQIARDPAIRLVSLMEATLYMGVGTLQAYLPLYALSIHISITGIGLLFGGQGLSSILSRPAMGRAADHFGRIPFIVGGVLLCAMVLAAIPHAQHFLPLLSLSILFGLGTGMVTPSTTALVGDLTKGNEFGSAMGVFGSLWDVGHATGPLVAGVLIGLVGYRLSFLVIALAILVALGVFISGRHHLRRPDQGSGAPVLS